MSKRTLMITTNADWRGALRAAGKRATARCYQGEWLNFESAASFFGKLTNATGWWVRPHAMFFEAVELYGERRARFEKVG